MGISQQFLKDEQGILFVVKNVSVDYRKPAVLDDELQVTAEVIRMTGASVEFKQAVWRAGTLLSSANVTLVCVDKIRMKPVPVPSGVAQKMRPGEKK